MLQDIKTVGEVLSKRSKSWSQMDALKNDRQALQEMYDRMMAVMEKGADSRSEGRNNVQGKKFSYAPDGKLANNVIERDMPDSQGTEVLRNM